MKIAVAIVNYKTADLVIDCLKSLIDERKDGFDIHVIVGDAVSDDGSVEKINKYIEENNLDWMKCVDNGENGGFAFGNNVIVQRQVFPDPSFDYVHFLNPDTYIYPGAVRALAQFLHDHPDAGMAGSRLENPDGSPRAYGFRFPTLWREFFRGARLSLLDKMFPTSVEVVQNLDTYREVDWVTGGSFMVPCEVLRTVGLMDDDYFLYFEDADLAHRVKKAGYQVWHVPESRVVHLAGQATGMRGGEVRRAPLPTFWLQSRCKFFIDRYGQIGVFFANLFYLTGDLLYRVHRFIRLKPIENPPGLWQSYLKDGFSPPPKRPR